MTFVSHRQDHYVLVNLSGRLDLARAHAFQEKIDLLFEEGVENIILDCEAVEYISAAGLKVILYTGEKIKDRSGQLIIVAKSSFIMQVFEDAGFKMIFQVVDALNVAKEQLTLS